MNWLGEWWRRPALKVQDPENSRRGKGSTFAGRDVGPQAAMQIAAWWACVRLYTETVSTLPLPVYERQADGSKKPVAASDPLYTILHDSPNADQTAAEFWSGIVLSLCVHGNGYAKKEKRTDGSLIALTPLPSDPSVMHVSRDAAGALRYRYTYRGKSYDLGSDDVFHVRGFGDGGDVGLSPLAAARQSLAIAEGIEASAGAVFKNGMKASVFFTAPPGTKALTTEQRKDFKQTFIDPYVGAEATASAGLLEQGFDVKTVSLPPRDAEMLLSWKFSIEEICRWHATPPVLIGHSPEGQTMWGSGIEQIVLGWYSLGLRPFLVRIEQAIKNQQIPAVRRSTIYAEFNVDGLLRGDSAGRAAMLSALGQNGYITRNEGRALENRPPLPGGDVLTVQSNLLPLDQLGKAGGANDQQARNALQSWLGIDTLMAELAKARGSKE